MVVTVARSVTEVEELRPVWEQLPINDIDGDIDYFLTVVRSDPTVVRPHVVMVERPDTTPILIVCRLVRQSFPLRLGYLDLGRVTAKTLVTSFDGILGARTETDYALAVDAVRLHGLDRDASLLQFQKLEDGLARRAIEANVAAVLRTRRPDVIRWTLLPPESFDLLLAARPSSSRQRIRRELSGFRRSHAGRFAVLRLDHPDHTSRLEPDIASVMLLTYQHGLGVGSVQDDLMVELRSLAVQKGWLRAWMLYLDDRPVAYWWGMLYRGVLAPGSTGYDPAYAREGVGFFTMMAMFEDLCADPLVTEIDFGHGDADYKQRFASHSTTSCDVLVFKPRPTSMLLKAVLVANTTVTVWLTTLSEQNRFARSIKRRWRTRATKTGKPATPVEPANP